MSKVLKGPARYIQGAGVLRELDRHLAGMGKRLLVMISRSGMGRFCSVLEECCRDYELIYDVFSGECCQSSIDRLTARAREEGCTAVLAIGGGRIMDTAKAVANFAGIPLVIVPTVASTDAPCSAVSVVYTETGEFDKNLFFPNGATVVLVDTEIIMKAPADLFVAGIGDALATYFEARACWNAGGDNRAGGKPTRAAYGLASMCWELLRQYGVRAVEDLRQGLCSEAVETVVEVAAYLSSVGFESGGLAVAHSLQKGLSFIPELHRNHHGCIVSFCTVVQLVMEQAAELEEVLALCTALGLPVSLADLGYPEPDHDLLRLAAEKTCFPGSTAYYVEGVTAETLYEAILKADALGRAYRAGRA